MSNQQPPVRPPLAGKPPYATDDDDSIFETAPKPAPVRRVPNIQAADKRDSVHNAYDEYHDKRDSGAAFGVGMGLMGEVSDDESDDETSPPVSANNGKNQALFEAATRDAAKEQVRYPGDIKQSRSPSPPQYSPAAQQSYKPAPGPSQGISITIPSGHQPPQPPRSPMPAPVPQHARASPARPVPAFMMPASPASPSPSYSSGPHPLPPSTPITPLFAAPPPIHQFPGSSVKFAEKDAMPIMRGNAEETPLVRARPNGARGAHGDDFWRRFSMVAHKNESGREKTSSWLEKTQSGGARLSVWVWVIGIVTLAAIGAGIGLGWYFTHNNPSHQRPVAIGGSAEEGMHGKSGASEAMTSTSSAVAHATVSVTRSAAVGARQVGEEFVPRAQPTAVLARAVLPAGHRRKYQTNRLD